MKLSLLGSIICSLACSVTMAEEGTAQLDAERIAINTCATCHGPQGRSTVPKFPVLAAQQTNYLVTQMLAFKAQTRGDADALGYMWGMAVPLDDVMISALAGYYSRQSPAKPVSGDSIVIARGKDLYQNGNAAEGIPACASCHGPNATGTETFPRLAGQHAQYVIKQLRSFQNNMRNVAVMHGVAEGLKVDEMKSVAAYLQSLP